MNMKLALSLHTHGDSCEKAKNLKIFSSVQLEVKMQHKGCFLLFTIIFDLVQMAINLWLHLLIFALKKCISKKAPFIWSYDDYFHYYLKRTPVMMHVVTTYIRKERCIINDTYVWNSFRTEAVKERSFISQPSFTHIFVYCCCLWYVAIHMLNYIQFEMNARELWNEDKQSRFICSEWDLKVHLTRNIFMTACRNSICTYALTHTFYS